MRKPIDDKARLLHILQAIAYVDEFMADRPKESLYDEPMFRFAVERQLEIIGEAANRRGFLFEIIKYWLFSPLFKQTP